MANSGADDTPPSDGRDADEARLAGYADALADAAEAVLAGWVERCVARRLADAHITDESVLDAATGEARVAGRRCAEEVGAALRTLLGTDVDEQRGTPLTLLRDAVRYPTAVLAAAGVPQVRRDEFEARAFPDDVYGLAPASFAEVDDRLHEPGITWGAAKAHVVMARRRAEGRRT